jgi:hypothetical protein
MTGEDGRAGSCGVQGGWFCAYSLRLDAKFVAQVQKASLETKDYGFPPDPALFGSPGWWVMTEDGTFLSHRLEGVITWVGWGGMGDWPEYTLTAPDGTAHGFTRAGGPRRYAAGLRAQVRTVELPRKESQAAKLLGVTASQVLTTLVEDSPMRSSMLAPGPGGAGFRLAGPPGWHVHYVWLPDRVAAEAVAGDLERAGRRVRVWDSPMTGAWAAITLPPGGDGAEPEHLLAATADRHGKYDGYDLIPDGGDSVAIGPAA